MNTSSNLRPIQKIFLDAMDLLDSKAHDYASTLDLHSNFKYAAQVMEPFPEEYKPYASLIGTKLARLAELLSKGSPRNEPIEDTFKDLINYCALMAERYTVDHSHRPSRGFTEPTVS